MPGNDKAALFGFLDHIAQRNLVKKGTAHSLKSACSAVFSVLDEEEQQDVLALDLDSVFYRFENARSLEVTPRTMQTYRQRVRQAVADFGRYQDSPSTWRPTASRRRPQTPKRAESSGTGAHQENGAGESSVLPTAQPPLPEKIVHQFPLRRDAIIQISGIPFDVTKAEMGRMTAFLSNLVADTEQITSAQLMLNAGDDESK